MRSGHHLAGERGKTRNIQSAFELPDGGQRSTEVFRLNPAPFSIARLPRIEFGAGSLARLPALAAQHGRRLLLLTGARSFTASAHWQPLIHALEARGLDWLHDTISGEPSPQRVDSLAARYRPEAMDVVVGIGGGSVLDAAKAVAGLLRVPHAVMDFLEGVGPELPYPGPAVPFIAVPTTAGTGSEATKNAVLSVQGPEGFKKSFRDEQLVPAWAVLDPDLLASCPLPQIAANGMDALTQLLEAYVSTRANPLTDALALSGLEAVRDGLMEWYQNTPAAAEGRTRMLYAALLSGICLAQTGLGSVHGLASPLGAFHPIPHGVVCGTLVAACTRMNIEALRARQPDSPALAKYAQAGRLLTRQRHHLADEAAHAALLGLLENWTHTLQLPRLAAYGVTAAGLPRITAHSRGSSMKTNPIALSDAEITQILTARL
jgi:alcohol dehydrogenase